MVIVAMLIVHVLWSRWVVFTSGGGTWLWLLAEALGAERVECVLLWWWLCALSLCAL